MSGSRFGFRLLRAGIRISQKQKQVFPPRNFSLPLIQQQIKFVPCISSRQIGTYKKHEQKSKLAEFDSDLGEDSDSDDEVSYVKQRGESAFWRRKMRTLHRLFDVNKDGVVSFDDFKLLTDKFTDLGHLSEKHRKEFQQLIQEAYELQIGTVQPYMTTEQFLEEMHHILNDKNQRKKVHQFLPYFFKAVDKDKSGEISVEEFKLFFKCLGLSESDALRSFKTIDVNGDGKLSLKEFVKLGREYLLSEDEKKPSKYFWGPLTED